MEFDTDLRRYVIKNTNSELHTLTVVYIKRVILDVINNQKIEPSYGQCI